VYCWRDVVVCSRSVGEAAARGALAREARMPRDATNKIAWRRRKSTVRRWDKIVWLLELHQGLGAGVIHS
jgi:hypothetical protein